MSKALRPVNIAAIAFMPVAGSCLWADLYANYTVYVHQPAMFQPVGGMRKIGDAFTRVCRDMIEFNAKVTKIHQDESGVTVDYVDSSNSNSDKSEGNNIEGSAKSIRADWFICNIPLSILTQIDINVSEPMKQAMAAVPYDSSFKVGLEFKRRFWEEDEWIYGGITYTDLPITQISYPSQDLFTSGTGVLLGAYGFGEASYRFNSLTPKERINTALGMANAFIRNIPKSYARVLQLLGIVSLGHLAAMGFGVSQAASNITIRYVP
jgi:monoamine oxidase